MFSVCYDELDLLTVSIREDSAARARLHYDYTSSHSICPVFVFLRERERETDTEFYCGRARHPRAMTTTTALHCRCVGHHTLDNNAEFLWTLLMRSWYGKQQPSVVLSLARKQLVISLPLHQRQFVVKFCLHFDFF